LKDKHILVGVAGGIAAYKSAALVSSLVKRNVQVTVAMSAAAKEFVGAATFAALSGRAVCDDMFDSRYPLGAHIELARQADLFCVAPATADFIGHAAHGLTGGLLSALYACVVCPVLVAPAMNVEMWNKPAVQRNVQQLAADGVHLVGPDSGWLSCRTMGAGRMAEPAEIEKEILRLLDLAAN
jgi:phosphopantothenoylcysteine decarboxylase/phosphopantothenate--cysteine ligase